MTIYRVPIARNSTRTLLRTRRTPIDAAACRSCACCRAELFWNALYAAGYDGRGLIVGFNLPFDLSRLAVDLGSVEDKRFAGGFSMALWD